ncbi:glutamate-cysteine ligase family protein [Amorphoplanes digitatis]|uniref:glutamate--cysteine ligase n=1 Tax=Actinoplanes digitatis TaxID=1868 RepID=A0A7W7HXS1_9ACTN|nr:glutamate-cysteine ligase family protein [Actinoplanes digitatis]MBB4762707.1 glutamate--cysteine ligase [Actinoplanes digitatis]GID91796.1 glutamate--cysteine ligase EgtA [Actinoplanes digitatis]
MTSLSESAAERLVADTAFAPGMPGFVGLAVDLLLDEPVPSADPGGTPGERRPLRHGFLTARSARIVTVSGPPSPGIESSAARMTEDLRMSLPLIGASAPDEAAGAAEPGTAGIRVGLEAGVDGAGPYGLGRRWQLAHAVAPVLAAAFANAPLRHGRPTGWRSVRQALRRDLPSAPPGADPRAAWTALVLDSPSGGHTFRELTRRAPADRPGAADLDRHLAALRPPVAARGHLEIDVADRQPGDGWLVPLAVTAALLDDAYAAAEAEHATRPLAGTPRLWERAARDALTDPELAAAARECFVAAYGALARQGVSREIRDAVAAFTERYVLRGRCPADDVLDRVTRATVIEAHVE